MRYVLWWIGVLCLGAVSWFGCSDNGSSSDAIRWAASVAVTSEEQPEQPGMHFGFRIAISNSVNSDVQWLTDGEQDDYKPAYSPDGSQIAFFRVVDYVAVPAVTWKTTLSVMNADGSDVRALTSGDYNDTTPYWTRDGSNQIIFCRWGPGQRVYVTSPDATPGDERLVSDPMFGDRPWSSLQDGRILVTRELPLPTAPFLLTPNVGGEPVYQEISYPFEDTYLHHMTISPSETKVAYMKVSDITLEAILAQDVHLPAIIAYADFDAENLRIENEVEITEFDDSTVDWYPSWSPDEKHIIYAHWGATRVIRAYSLETGITEQISSRDDLDYRYPTVVGQTK